ncbi:MAG TPA: divalent metal cation transporter [Opitutales bacterium]|nr:divalent metal cation transporter [Opitutales bacterium]
MNDTPATPASDVKGDASPSGRSNLLKALGPGILVACAAVGGSHLVWSTRAGADFGWSLVFLITLTNFLKFPFFLYGQRYTAATGESLLDGYLRQGRGFVHAFLLINILTATINIAGVGMVTGSLLKGYGLDAASVQWLTVGVIAVCVAMILFGHYKLLDGLSKWVLAVLSACTLAAVVIAMRKGAVAPEGYAGPSPWNLATLPFLVSLLGWMPAPVDLSAWSSLWMFSREKQTGHFATVKETSVDFYLSYGMTALLAIAFVALGRYVMWGSGQSFSQSGTGFAFQLVNLYAATIGDWSRWLILSCAFLTMFSTTITCVDGYPRALAASCQILRGRQAHAFRSLHQFWIVLISLSAAVVVLFFVRDLMQMLVFATVVSFVTSPILAWINLRVMSGKNVPESHRPGLFLRIVSWTGLIFFAVMGGGYLYVEFF